MAVIHDKNLIVAPEQVQGKASSYLELLRARRQQAANAVNPNLPPPAGIHDNPPPHYPPPQLAVASPAQPVHQQQAAASSSPMQQVRQSQTHCNRSELGPINDSRAHNLCAICVCLLICLFVCSSLFLCRSAILQLLRGSPRIEAKSTPHKIRTRRITQKWPASTQPFMQWRRI